MAPRYAPSKSESLSRSKSLIKVGVFCRHITLLAIFVEIFGCLGDDETAVRIYGKDADIEDARREIEELLGFAPSTTPIGAHLLAIDPKHFGKIIGEGGATLKKLEDDAYVFVGCFVCVCGYLLLFTIVVDDVDLFSDCNIIVPSHHDKDKRILLEGNDESIKKAVAAIEVGYCCCTCIFCVLLLTFFFFFFVE
jgi:hypothetical protein